MSNANAVPYIAVENRVKKTTIAVLAATLLAGACIGRAGKDDIDKLIAMDKRPYLEHIREMEKLAKLANGGVLGCGVGGMKIETPSGTRSVQCNVSDPDIFGSETTLAELHSILIARDEGNRLGTGPLAETGETLCFSTLCVLGSLADSNSIPVIVPMLSDPTGLVRKWSVTALAQIGEKDPSLRSRIGDSVETVLRPTEGTIPSWLARAFRQPLLVVRNKDREILVKGKVHDLDSFRKMLKDYKKRTKDTYVITRDMPGTPDDFGNKVNRIIYEVGMIPKAQKE